MEFKQLEAFAAVVRLGSFSHAAERLFLTQPTISAHVGALEKELGSRLLVRAPGGAYPTPEGAALFEYASEMLTLRENAIAHCGRSDGRLAGTVRVAASTVTHQYVLPRAMALFREVHPDVRFDIDSGDSAHAVAAILEGRSEIGMAGAQMDEPRCVFERFMEDELVVITPAAPPYDGSGADFPIERLASLPFVIREPGSGTRKQLDEFLKRHGLSIEKLNIAACVEGTDAVRGAVSQGLGISVVSRLAVEEYGRLGLVRVFRPEGGMITRHLYLVHHKSRRLSPAAQGFLDFMRSGA